MWSNTFKGAVAGDATNLPPAIGTRIRQIQRGGRASPLNGSLFDNVPGVVITGAAEGFYLEDADGDGKPKHQGRTG